MSSDLVRDALLLEVQSPLETTGSKQARSKPQHQSKSIQEKPVELLLPRKSVKTTKSSLEKYKDAPRVDLVRRNLKILKSLEPKALPELEKVRNYHLKKLPRRSAELEKIKAMQKAKKAQQKKSVFDDKDFELWAKDVKSTAKRKK